MAAQISIITEAAAGIASRVQSQIEVIEAAMGTLDKDVQSLLTDADWKGDAADKFFDVYNSVRETFTKKVPEDLTTLRTNIDTNLSNLISADAQGAH